MPTIPIPTKKQIVKILKAHPLFKYKGIILNAYIVGSFCRGNAHKESDIDILLQVPKVNGFDDESYTELQRKPIRDYFVKNGIKDKRDDLHPQYDGRRIDIYFTFNERLTDCIRLW